MSVLIPSHGRPEKLIRCLTGLAEQTDPADEILVGLDGGSKSEAEGLMSRFSASLGSSLRVTAFEKVGYISIRRRLLEIASSDVFLSLNDDVFPASSLVASHKAAHREGATRLVIGPAPFAPVERPTLFDRLVAESDLVFFGSTRHGDDSAELTFRDCYGLNLSALTAQARQLGGVPDLPDCYGYDDIELAHRLTRAGAEICFVPSAAVEHDHRLAPAAVLRREYELGRAAAAYAEISPAFARELFRRDIMAADELAYCREVLNRERRDAERIERSFLRLAELPGSAVPDQSPVLHTLAEHWVLLKRYLWRWGLIDAADRREKRWSLVQEAPELP